MGERRDRGGTAGRDGAAGGDRPLIGVDDLEQPFWLKHQAELAETGFWRHARTTPRVVAALLRWSWQVSPRLTVLTGIVQIVSAAVTAFGLLATADVFTQLLTEGPTPQRVLDALPALAVLVGALLVRGLLQVAIGALQAELAPLIELAAQDELYSGLAEVDLIAFDDPDFTQLIDRAVYQAIYRIRSGIIQVGDLAAALVSVTAAVVAAGILHPALAPLVLLGGIPQAWAGIRGARAHMASIVRMNSQMRRRDVTGQLLSERDAAAELRAFTANGILLREHRRISAQIAADAVRLERTQNLLTTAGRAVAALCTGLTYGVLGVLLFTGGLALPLAGTAVVALRTASGAIANGVYSMNQLFEVGIFVDLYRNCLAELRARRRAVGSAPGNSALAPVRPTSTGPAAAPTAGRPQDAFRAGGPRTASPTGGPTTASPARRPTTASPTDRPTTASPIDRPTTASPADRLTTASPTNGLTTASPARGRQIAPTAGGLRTVGGSPICPTDGGPSGSTGDELRTAPTTAGPDAITLAEVCFRYPGQPADALHSVSLTLRRGQVIALVGENGSGKTTLAKLITGLYLPSSGSVRWDGVDTREIATTVLFDQVAVVMQDPLRWPMTAENNIRIGRLGRPDPDRAVFDDACARSGAGTVLGELPNGADTVLSKRFQGGRDLSGGQWQRISVARGLYRDAPVVVADEPTAAMDARAEHAVFAALRGLADPGVGHSGNGQRGGSAPAAGGRITVLVTHRLANVRHADQIIVLEQGRVIEMGDHDELMALGGTYAELFSLQASAYADDVRAPIGRDGSPMGTDGSGAAP